MLPDLLTSVKPELVLYDAGVDPHGNDALGRLSLTSDGLFRRDMQVRAWFTGTSLLRTFAIHLNNPSQPMQSGKLQLPVSSSSTAKCAAVSAQYSVVLRTPRLKLLLLAAQRFFE